MAPVRPDRPRRLAVQTIEEGQVSIETRLVERPIYRGERERVLAIVEVTKLDSLGTRITRRVRHYYVLDLRPPEAFESNRVAAARNDGLGERGDQCRPIESLYDRRKGNLD